MNELTFIISLSKAWPKRLIDEINDIMGEHLNANLITRNITHRLIHAARKRNKNKMPKTKKQKQKQNPKN